MLLWVQILLYCFFFAKHRVSPARVENVYEISLWLIWKLLVSLIWKEFDDDVKASGIIKHFSFFQKNYKLFAVRSCCCRSSSSSVGTSCSAHTFCLRVCRGKKLAHCWGSRSSVLREDIKISFHISLSALCLLAFAARLPHTSRMRKLSKLSQQRQMSLREKMLGTKWSMEYVQAWWLLHNFRARIRVDFMKMTHLHSRMM